MEPNILTGRLRAELAKAAELAELGKDSVVMGQEDSLRRIHRQDAGFTLIELIIVMAIIGILMMIAVPRFKGAVRQAQEAVLKEDLHVLRTAIDSYTMDKQKAPQSLQDLIEDGYLKAVPEDPFTRSKETWVPDSSDSMHSLDQTEPGIDDVHSGAQETGSDGQPYSSW
jgi:general secretion pathway protein G